MPIPPAPAVLLVDDDATIARLLKERLGRALGAQVIHARSGPEAMNALRRERVDLILADQKMPGMTGIEFLAEAAVVAPRVPRAMLTAERDLGLAIQAINDAHVAAFFTKPVDPPLFIGRVQSILARKRAAEMREAGLVRATRLFQHQATLRGESPRSEEG